MRTCDIRDDDPLLPGDLQGRVWVYRPIRHKKEHHGHSRTILIGPRAQAILQPWFRPTEPEAFIFSPTEAKEWHVAQRAQGRTSNRNDKPRKKKPNPKCKPGKLYPVNSYYHAVIRACNRAGVQRWSPHQLRHNAGTAIRKKFGAEMVQVLLGHENLNVSEIYADRDYDRAARAIIELG